LRHPRADGQDPVRVTSQDELLETVESSSRTFSLMLGAIAAISLVVGGIGIMNILLVSVRERTREIGVRMAVGARRRDILAQFLLEAVLLSLAGGLVGVAAGVGGATALARLGNWPAAVPADAVLVALGFAVAVGLFFGVYPAVQASRLDPVQALRSE
ncbi:MAG: FtsX-like permease family protein, partial [Clostridia bacterium]|nr:FtsX-like permease family protein [Clostridia bacterium]